MEESALGGSIINGAVDHEILLLLHHSVIFFLDAVFKPKLLELGQNDGKHNIITLQGTSQNKKVFTIP